jgi:hypothetical protein
VFWVAIYFHVSTWHSIPKIENHVFSPRISESRIKYVSEIAHNCTIWVSHDITQFSGKLGMSSSGVYKVPFTLHCNFELLISDKKWSKSVHLLKKQYMLDAFCSLPDIFTTCLAVKLVSLPHCFWYLLIIDSRVDRQTESSFTSSIDEKIANFCHFLHLFLSVSRQLWSRSWQAKVVFHSLYIVMSDGAPILGENSCYLSLYLCSHEQNLSPVLSHKLHNISSINSATTLLCSRIRDFPLSGLFSTPFTRASHPSWLAWCHS